MKKNQQSKHLDTTLHQAREVREENALGRVRYSTLV